MAIVRIYTGDDGRSHFQDIEPEFHPVDGGWPIDGDAVIQAEGGILLRRFDPNRSNPWHSAPGRVCVFTVSGAVEIEVGDGTKRRIGPGDILIAEDITGQGHYTRELGDDPRISMFVPIGTDVGG